MKPHPSARDSSVKGSSSQPTPSGRPERARPKGHEYDLTVSYYRRMRVQGVYPLVVEVPRGKGEADRPTGLAVTLRPVVPGAVVAPAELPLEVSRPGARATFYVTPLVRGRLPEARVVVLNGGQQVQELQTRMTTKTQRLAWVLLLLALVVPALVLHWTYTAPLRGPISDKRKKLDLGQKPAEEEKELAVKRQKPETQPPLIRPGGGPGGGPPGKPAGGKPGGAAAGAPVLQADEVPPPGEGDDIFFIRPGMPGEVLEVRLRSGLSDNVPDFPGGKKAIDVVAGGAGTAYGWLYGVTPDLRPAFWLGVVLLMLAFGSWVLHLPTRVRRRVKVTLAPLPSGATVRGAQTGETLPLAPHGEGG